MGKKLYLKIYYIQENIDINVFDYLINQLSFFFLIFCTLDVDFNVYWYVWKITSNIEEKKKEFQEFNLFI